MYLTRSRICLLALPCVLAVACGQVTGLSNDYQFDLTDGGTTSGDAAADAHPDSPSSVEAGPDAGSGPKCSTAERTLATANLATIDKNGAPDCRTCLVDACCSDIDTCASAPVGTTNSECKRALSCRLDCTTRSGSDRTDCLSQCTSPVVFAKLSVCSSSNCMGTCGF